MHRYRSQARNLAWTDERNPFAKRRARKSTDPYAQAEGGNGSVLYRPNTDDPTNYKPAGQQLSATPGWSHPNATAPDALSHRRPNEPGDAIKEVPYATSPSASLEKLPIQGESSSSEQKVSQPEHEEERDSNTLHEPEKVEEHGWRKWKHRISTDKHSEEQDDNNGKSKPKKKFTLWSQIRATVFSSWINILLICSPIGIVLHAIDANYYAVFVVNFIAIIPLAGMLSYATEEIALRTGEVVGGLLNASFGNAVELIVAIIALAQDQILIVQTSLIGSMLSNLLLVMGMCFFGGGINRMEQAFNITVAQTAASLLFLAVSSLIIPTAFNEWANTSSTDKTSSDAPLANGVAALSRGTAICLLVVYACYLFFQLKSHAKMYNLPGEKNDKRDFTKQKDKMNKMKNILPDKIRRRSLEPTSPTQSEGNSDKGTEEEREEPQLSLWTALLTLCLSTALVGVNSEFLVDAINPITCGSSISKSFVGLILLPIVGNAAEHTTAVTVAIKDKMDLAIGVAVGSSMQIALLVLPLTVVLGWIIGKDDMTLYFDGFQIAVLFVAVLLVNYLIQDGKSHWLEGVLLMVLYIIIAVAAWFYPTDPSQNGCPS